ncbi:MAG: HAD-IIA family hydrolase [Acidimicrobiia bacterium]
MTVVCCDLDGVIWRGEEAIPGSARAVADLRAAGLPVTFLTNNSSATLSDYVAKLGRMGIDADPADIGSSAQAAALLLADTVPAGSRVLVCAGAGVREALAANGFEPVDAEPADAVVVGWHREFDFERLTRAADVARRGAPFVATNTDSTYPVPGGFVPGAGALVAAVETAASATAVVAGKPEAPTVALVRRRWGRAGVIVGDRPSTDGALARALEWPFALVLTGVAGSPGGEPVPDPAPPFVAADLAALAPALARALVRADAISVEADPLP